MPAKTKKPHRQSNNQAPPREARSRAERRSEAEAAHTKRFDIPPRTGLVLNKIYLLLRQGGACSAETVRQQNSAAFHQIIYEEIMH